MSASTCWSTSSSPSIRARIVLFSLFCGALFTAVVGTMGAKFVMELYATDQVSPDLEMPRWIVFSAVPLGSYLMCFRFLQVAWNFWHTGDLPHTDETEVEGIEVETPASPPAPAAMTAAIIFGLLIALMLTGMPISIALGLTVLTFLFTMTQVPIEAVALKLFTGIENFEIMAIPFFILAGNFLTHGGVARRMIAFATTMIGHWYGGLGIAGDHGGGAVFGGLGLVAGDGRRDRLDHAAGDAAGRLSRSASAAGVIVTGGALGNLIPPSIIMVIYAVATGGAVVFRAGRPEGAPRLRSGSCSWPAWFRG